MQSLLDISMLHAAVSNQTLHGALTMQSIPVSS